MAHPLRFQHFEVLARPDGSPHVLGKGAMGLTYKAFDRNLHSLAVVKVIAPQLAGRPEARQRFLQEAQAMAKIQHPHVADVFHLGDSPHGVFYAMEFCDGPSTQEYVEEKGPVDPGDVLNLGLQAAQALEEVHRHNLIHRDIKPSNLLLVSDAQGRSQVKLIDFGLARDMLRDAERDPNLSQGGFVGTPTFASPEQLLEQDDLDIRSDIYSLGITLWFMLAGRPPFSGSQFEVMFHHVNSPPPWDRLPVMPAEALAVLRRMIEKNPGDRFQTPSSLVAELRRVIDVAGYGAAGGARLNLGKRTSSGSVLGMSAFEIISETDSDLTGKIFRARDAHSGETVALKYLHPEIVAKPAVLARIQRHALSLRALQHPHLLGVLGFEKSEDGAKIIQEWARGPSLLAVLKARNQLSLKEAAPLLGQLASALDFASSRGVHTLETDLHQIVLTAPAFGEDAAAWAAPLRQPVAQWGAVALKINPLRLSLAEQDYPSLGPGPSPDASTGGPKPLLGSFLQLAHRLLGGAGGSQASSVGGFVSIPGLGAEANDLLESFALPPFTPEKRETTCATILRSLCQAEGVAEPAIYEPPPEPEEDLLKTRDASTGAGSASQFARGSSMPGLAPPSHFRPAFTTPSHAGRLGSSVRFGSQAALGSSAGRISADYHAKRQQLERQWQQLEAGSAQLKQNEVLEATRAILEEEHAALAEAKEEFARQERERAQRAEAERRKLEDERRRLEAQTSEIESKRREQERLEQEIRLRAQFEFQKFEEERRQREAEWARQREEIERSLKEREEQSLLREQLSFKKLREERERVQRLQTELEQGQVRPPSEAEAALRQQVAALEAERHALASQQAELDRKLLAQNQEFARLKEQFDAAEREIEARHQRLATEEIAAAQRRQEEIEAERARLADERRQLEAQRLSLTEQQKADSSAHAELAGQQKAETEQALARLAAEETRLAAARSELETQRAQRESELAAELARAKQDLENERASLAAEAGRAKEASLAELEAGRADIAATRAHLAAQEQALASQVQAKEKDLEEQLARQRQEIEHSRAQLAAERTRLDAEQERLTAHFAREKEAFAVELEARRLREEEEHRQRVAQRAAELSRLESDQEARLSTLRTEIAAEETRLQKQKEEVFAQERLISRMDQEAAFQDEEASEDFEAERVRLEAQRAEIAQQIAEFQQAQKKAQKRRLITITAGTIIGIICASIAGYYIKGRLLDPSKLKGQEAWVQYENERKATVSEKDWPKLLNWCVQTDERFQRQEQDPVLKNFYKEKRGGVLADARAAISGLLAALESGWQPPPPQDDAFKKLRQNLDVVAQWDGIPGERLLVLAKLDMPYLTAQGNPGAALDIYARAVKADPAFIPRLQKELAVTVQGLLDDFLADYALDGRDALFSQLRALPKAAQDSAPRTWLLLYLLKSEEMRAGPPSVRNYSLALESVNAPRLSEDTSGFFSQDAEWAAVLRPQMERVLATIKTHPETINRLEEELRATAEQWATDAPFMMLAEAATLNQKKLDFYQAAEALSGNIEAKARVAGFYLQLAETKQREGQAAEARHFAQEALSRLKETADAAQPEALSLMADQFRLGSLVPKDLSAAIEWAAKARDAGHPDADFTLGLCYLEQAEDSKNEALLQKAADSFRAATQREASPNAGRAWYFLATISDMRKDYPGVAASLEKGAERNDPASLFFLGQCRIAGKPYYPSANLTLGRDNIAAAARLGHPNALTWVRTNARDWQRSTRPADREWLQKNADLLQ